MLWKGRRRVQIMVDRRCPRGNGGRRGFGHGRAGGAVSACRGSGRTCKSSCPLPGQRHQTPTPAQEEAGQFVAMILAETEDVWHSLLDGTGVPIANQTGAVFRRDGIRLRFAQSAIGPFYCSADESIYMDLDFLSDLQNRLGADGISRWRTSSRTGGPPCAAFAGDPGAGQRPARRPAGSRRRLAVRPAGIAGGLSGRGLGALRPPYQGTAGARRRREGVAAAGAVGDDRIQRQSQGYVVPDSFTHGTSAQRTAWFMKGFQTGDVSQGDTFATQEL